MKSDELHDTFEARLQAGLAHIAESSPTATPDRFDPDRLTLRTWSGEPRRRVVAYAAAAAIVVGGLTVVAALNNRSPSPAPAASSPPVNQQMPSTTTETVNGDVTGDGWYELLRPIIPPRFAHLALVDRTDNSARFVAVDAVAGKSIDITIESGAPHPAAADVDDTGAWAETPQGWTVTSRSQIRADVTCNIGAKGQDFPGPPNYCEMTSVGPMSKAELHTIAAAAVTTPLIEAAAGTPLRGMASDGIGATIAAALPGQQLMTDVHWGAQDRVWEFGSDPAGLPDTSIRLISGVFSPPPTRTPDPLTTGGIIGLYEDAAAFWMLDPSGIAIRIGTTDPTPESLERLTALANTIFTAALANPVFPSSTIPAAPTTEPVDSDVTVTT